MKQVTEIKKLASQKFKASEIKMDEMFGQEAFCLATIFNMRMKRNFNLIQVKTMNYQVESLMNS